MWKNMEQPADDRWKYGAWALCDKYQKIQTHTHTVLYLLIFHWNNVCTEAVFNLFQVSAYLRLKQGKIVYAFY
jgi:hypothetical protein